MTETARSQHPDAGEVAVYELADRTGQ
jgi:hypothetical protein